MFGKKPAYLPQKEVFTYRIVSALLYAAFLFLLFVGGMSLLFPYTRYEFDFNNPDATKNSIFFPHLEKHVPVEKGKISEENTLFFYANNWHDLEYARVYIEPSKSSKTKDLTGLPITIRHGWSALFLPRNEEMLTTTPLAIREYQGAFYELKDDTLFPFVSEQAALSHQEREQIQTLSEREFTSLKKGEEFSGFRIGTLLSYADGVFVVTENRTLRPFGSADILTRFEYSFDHIITANAEEAGIYTRDKIILTGQMHPEGTLFKENESGTLYVKEQNMLRKVEESYANFLASKNDIIYFDGQDLLEASACTLSKALLQNTYRCIVPLPTSFQGDDDYQISLENPREELDIAFIQLGFQASRREDNARFVARTLLNRVLERFKF